MCDKNIRDFKLLQLSVLNYDLVAFLINRFTSLTFAISYLSSCVRPNRKMRLSLPHLGVPTMFRSSTFKQLEPGDCLSKESFATMVSSWELTLANKSTLSFLTLSTMPSFMRHMPRVCWLLMWFNFVTPSDMRHVFISFSCIVQHFEPEASVGRTTVV